jgi:hypothetical protein
VLAEPGRNERILVAGAAVAPLVPLPPLDDEAGPGWFSLCESGRIGTVLRAAALSDVAIEHRGQRCTAIQPHNTALEWVYRGMRRLPRGS